MFVSFILLWICVFFFIPCLKCQKPRNFPPGPPPLPILRNLLNLSLNNPVRDCERVLWKCLQPLHQTQTVISGFQAMKEAMMTRTADFARSQTFLSVTSLREDWFWQTVVQVGRSIASMTLRNFGLDCLVHGAEDSGRVTVHNGNTGKEHWFAICATFSPQLTSHNVAADIVCQVLFGERYGYDDNFKVVFQCFKENSKITNGPLAMLKKEFLSLRLYDSVPMIRNLLLPFMKAFKNIKTCKKLVTLLITEHKETTVPVQPRAFPACYLHELDEEEMDQVLEKKDHTSYDDRHNMPYMRGKPIIQNLNSVLNEEGQWKFPDELNPENFLNDKEEFSKPEAFVPFSAGPCTCLACMELFLIMVTLLREFKFIWLKDAKEPGYTLVYGVTLSAEPRA